MTRFKTYLPWLQLFRFNGAFTAASGSLCGYFLFTSEIHILTAITVPFISMLLFSAGMGFNDIVDRKKDSILRPERPLPSEKITLASAKVVCSILVILAFLLSFTLSNFHVLFTLLLFLFITFYNLYAKKNNLASLSITACRICNFTLGCGSFFCERGYFIPVAMIFFHTFSIMKMADGEDEALSLSKKFYLYQGLVLVLSFYKSVLGCWLWLIFLFLSTKDKIWTDRKDRIQTVGQLVVGFCLLDAVILLCFSKSIYIVFPIVFWFLCKRMSKKLTVS